MLEQPWAIHSVEGIQEYSAVMVVHSRIAVQAAKQVVDSKEGE